MGRESGPSVVGQKRPLEDLETIQMLEETLGPRGLRDLRSAFEDEADRRILESLARHHAEDLHELDDVIHTWRRLVGTPKPQPERVERMDTGEILESLVELKESEAEMLRRAATKAPSERVRERLLALAARAEGAAEKLKSLA